MAHICERKGGCQGCPYYRFDDETGSNSCWYTYDHKGRSKLTDVEYNAISRLTHNTKLEEVFDVVDLGNEDGFYDYDNHEYVPIRTGLLWLLDGLAYSLYHDGLDDEEAHLITQLFSEFNIATQSQIEQLLKKEEH